MAARLLESSKAKIARRVIEVFEYFSAANERATVMDIARCYHWPQSSTSELLSSLAELGLLYKDPVSRSFTPTPRLAAMGMAAQPEIIRNGLLFNFMDRLVQTTRMRVALFGMVGLHVQAFRWLNPPSSVAEDVGCGASELLSHSAAGLLLLSTLSSDQAQGALWRLYAEASPKEKFDRQVLAEQVMALRQHGHATGTAGFVAGMQMTAMLLPREIGERPLALGVLYAPEEACEPSALVETLRRGISRARSDEPREAPMTAQLIHAM